METFSRPPSRGSSDCADPEASWGHRSGGGPGQDSELFFGYYASAATMMREEHGPPVPELARRMTVSLLPSRPGPRPGPGAHPDAPSEASRSATASMTHHKNRNRLECHYCGSVQPIPKNCHKCHSKYVYFFGEGSEQLEERLRKEFPKARIARLDRDTARTKRQYQETLGAFADGALDILVGTQMLAKGHDFHRVTLVGVISADSSLTMPDFRAAERTFQLMTQVAGRAGRGELPGRVLIQTFYPEHYAIQDAIRQDYVAFYERELHYRQVMAYPPFTSLANVIVRDSNLEKAITWSRELSQFLAPHNGEGIRVLGPASAPLARLKTEYRFQFLLKSKRKAQLTKILSGVLAYCDRKEIPQTAVLVDMDPLQLL